MVKKTRKSFVQRKVQEAPLQGQYDLDGNPLSGPSLRDKIPERPHTIFVGINPAIRSAQVGHYYAGYSNYFWKLIHASGIWPIKLKAENDDDMVAKGFGFTDVAKRPTPGAADLSKADFMASKDRLRNIARVHKPKTIVFVSKTALRAFLGDQNAPVDYGLQELEIDGVPVFLVPSTSGQSLGDTSYSEKLKWFKELRRHIATYFDYVSVKRQR